MLQAMVQRFVHRLSATVKRYRPGAHFA